MIAAAWLSYPIAGAANLGALTAEGKAAEDAGFSFMPELIVFPPMFFGIAWGIDRIAEPWGSRLIAAVCAVMICLHIKVVIQGFRRIRIAEKRNDNEAVHPTSG
jgi:hypothetical protein